MSVTKFDLDEAHRGTGDYAYAQVIRFLMAKNPHFRVLALTATPGSKPEAVQKLVDNLHISRIEIRDEDSLDLKAYTHTKVSSYWDRLIIRSFICCAEIRTAYDQDGRHGE